MKKRLLTNHRFNEIEKIHINQALNYYKSLIQSSVPLKAVRIKIQNKGVLYPNLPYNIHFKKWINIFLPLLEVAREKLYFENSTIQAKR